MAVLSRIKGILLTPQTEWDAVARDTPATSVLLRSYLLPLSLLTPLATVIGMLFFDTRWSAEYGYSILRDRAPFIALTTYAFQIGSVYLLAAVLYLLARTERRAPSFLVALQVAVFGTIPVQLSGVFLVIPFGVVASLLAMMYAFYLYYLGAERLIGVRPADSAMFIGVAMVCMILLSSIIGGIASATGIV